MKKLPAMNATTKTLISFLVLLIFVISCETKTTTENAAATPNQISNDSLITRGEYLVATIGCDDCHSPKKMGPNGPEVIPELRLSGYPSTRPLPKVDSAFMKTGWMMQANSDLTAFVGPWGVSYAANITGDETGIGSWTEEQFRKALTEGKWKGMDNSRTLLPPMPWFNYRNMKPEDVKAIFTYLKATNPVKNIEPPVQPLNAL